MKKKLAIIGIILVLFTTGCTKNFKDEDTKKTYASNILCKPSTTEITKIYESNKKELKIDYDKLVSCKNFKVTSGGYEGLWTSLFVKPLAWVIIKLGLLIKSYGISIMILGVLIRILMFPLTKKSTSMSKDMNKMKPEMDRIEKKYANKTDQASLNMKAQETMMLYKKYNINPLSSCLFAFLQIPIFFAFLEAIQRIPVIYEENLLGFKLGLSPTEAFSLGKYQYIILIILILLTTYYSFKNMNTTAMDEKQAKQMKSMNLFMVVFIGIASFTLPAAIALYWIVSSGYTILQNYLMQRVPQEEGNIKTIKAKKSKNKKNK